MARDFPAVTMKANILAHAALGKVFNLPTVLTSSSDTGERVVPVSSMQSLTSLPRSERPSASGNSSDVS